MPQTSAAQAQEWRELRRLKGHFEGEPWNEALDRWQGRKHQLMLEFAADLLRRRARTNDVLQTLGRPDAQLAPQDPAYEKAARQRTQVAPLLAPPAAPTVTDKRSTRAPSLWLYHWRSTHDQLVLSLHQGRVSATGWLHDFE